MKIRGTGKFRVLNLNSKFRLGRIMTVLTFSKTTSLAFFSGSDGYFLFGKHFLVSKFSRTQMYKNSERREKSYFSNVPPTHMAVILFHTEPIFF